MAHKKKACGNYVIIYCSQRVETQPELISGSHSGCEQISTLPCISECLSGCEDNYLGCGH